jgi:hypothetical protein
MEKLTILGSNNRKSVIDVNRLNKRKVYIYIYICTEFYIIYIEFINGL